MMQTLASNNHLTLACKKVIQKNVEFFIGKLTAKELLSIASVSHRIITAFDENGFPLYNKKVQRKPNTARVKSIKDYLILDDNASFPNNILLSIPSTLLVEEITDRGSFYEIIIDKNKIDFSLDSPLYVQIIDGQHRFRGMEEAILDLKGSNEIEKLTQLQDFEFVVSIFIDAEIDFQAMLFSTINRTPIKVSQDLVYDLFGLTLEDSPQKTSLAIALELNGLKETEVGNVGPFYKRIRLLGKKEKGENSPISQSMFIKTLISLICPSLTIAERERFISRKAFLLDGSNKTIFRNFYAEDSDNKIFLVILNFFIAARETFISSNDKSYWDFENGIPENVFQKTIGFLALTDILIELFPLGMREKTFNIAFFKKYLAKAKDIQLLDNLGQSIYPYSSKGRTLLRDELHRLIF